MKPLSRVSLVVATGAVALVLPFAQTFLSPSAYGILWVVFIAVAVVVIAASLGLPQLALGKDRERLAALRKTHPGALAELVAAWEDETAAFLATILVDETGVLLESRTGFSRRLTWSQVTGLKSVQYGRTYRVGMEIMNTDRTFCVMPVSGSTLLAVSLGRADVFFDAVKEEWRASQARHLP